jgi:hypothetical protein
MPQQTPAHFNLGREENNAALSDVDKDEIATEVLGSSPNTRFNKEHFMVGEYTGQINGQRGKKRLSDGETILLS